MRGSHEYCSGSQGLIERELDLTLYWVQETRAAARLRILNVTSFDYVLRGRLIEASA